MNTILNKLIDVMSPLPLHKYIFSDGEYLYATTNTMCVKTPCNGTVPVFDSSNCIFKINSLIEYTRRESEKIEINTIELRKAYNAAYEPIKKLRGKARREKISSTVVHVPEAGYLRVDNAGLLCDILKKSTVNVCSDYEKLNLHRVWLYNSNNK